MRTRRRSSSTLPPIAEFDPEEMARAMAESRRYAHPGGYVSALGLETPGAGPSGHSSGSGRSVGMAREETRGAPGGRGGKAPAQSMVTRLEFPASSVSVPPPLPPKTRPASIASIASTWSYHAPPGTGRALPVSPSSSSSSASSSRSTSPTKSLFSSASSTLYSASSLSGSSHSPTRSTSPTKSSTRPLPVPTPRSVPSSVLSPSSPTKGRPLPVPTPKTPGGMTLLPTSPPSPKSPTSPDPPRTPSSARTARAVPLPFSPSSARTARAIPLPTSPSSARTARDVPLPTSPSSARTARAMPLPPSPSPSRYSYRESAELDHEDEIDVEEDSGYGSRSTTPTPLPLSGLRSPALEHPGGSQRLSPLSVTRGLRTPSVVSAPSASSGSRTPSSGGLSTKPSFSSLLTKVAESARHERLDGALERLVEVTTGSAYAASIRSAATSLKSGKSRHSTREDSANTAEALAKLHFIATSPFACQNPGCGAVIPAVSLEGMSFPPASDVPPALIVSLLHAHCTSCTQTHCRGCGVPTACPAACSPCAVISRHCAAARALGGLTALIAFDRAHILTREPGRIADKPLLAPLSALAYFLDPCTDSDGQQPPLDTDPALPVLLRHSRVPGYAAGLLRTTDFGAWMTRAPAYTAVLRLLRFAPTHRPMSRRAVSGAGTGAWYRSRNPAVIQMADSGEEDVGESLSLQDLIRQLEPVRMGLLKLTEMSKFRPTLEKAHALCDAVLYLQLQDVLAEEDI
ncbi:unnamed protein product [Mycena citricolor]|uniref:Uncharacterized protein n=1 Tax=Mycena citricolor TaxID=2018698 RepID=A0AAD2HAT4_9AGAR|nr:unnamed protein product [Mycena citricolor]